MTSPGEPEVPFVPGAAVADPGAAVADPGAMLAGRDFESAPDVPAQAPQELLALKSGAVFLCARRDGDMGSGRAGDVSLVRPSGEGLYARDTRHLSELRLTIGGSRPVLLSSAMESGHLAVINATNPVLRSSEGIVVAQETLNVRRTVLVADRLFYRVRVRNFNAHPVSTVVALSLAADFADVFEVRGVERHAGGHSLPPVWDEHGVRFRYVAADGECRETLVEFEPAPERLRTDGGRARVAWDLKLAPGQAASMLVTALPTESGANREALTAEEAGAQLESARPARVRACRLAGRLRERQDRQASVRSSDRRFGA
jgi:glycogen debranching enzyme